MIIVIDPGHDATTPGKRSPQIPPGIREFEFNRNVAHYCATKLSSFGLSTVFTVPDDPYQKVRLKERRIVSGDIFLSIHANAIGSGGWRNKPRDRGAIIFCNELGLSLAKKLISIYCDLIFEIPKRRLGAEVNNNLYVLKNQNRPALLVECGMMTHYYEAKFLSIPYSQFKIGEALAIGLYEYLGKE
jgi:N-acetylmuramoyl-L-alanine amidase